MMAILTSLRATILIVSDTAARDPSTDQTGDVLHDVFGSGDGDGDGDGDRWTVAEKAIVRDCSSDIQRRITRWADGTNPVNLIVVSGGTGFAEDDHTPEVRALDGMDSSAHGLM